MISAKHRKKRNRGVTMVELIVSFALLAIFLTTATMCISHAVIYYYTERQLMSAYSVADMVLSEVKDELRTMQDSRQNGYVKIREKDADDKLVAVHKSSGSYTGTTIEFVASNISDGANAVQLDVEGCKDIMIDDKQVINDDLQNIDPNYLTLRYYNRYPEKQAAGYKKLYMDVIVPGTSAATSGNYNSVAGRRVVWHAQEKLPVQAYQNYTVSLEFSVRPQTDTEGNEVVKYVDVTVNVNDVSGMVYQKKRRVDLQNNVYYTNEKTMYSDGAAAVESP